MKNIPNIPFIPLLLAIIVGYFLGIFIDMPDNDSSHHASIALRMLEMKDWAFLADHSGPYLDKPHFQMWLVALSFWKLGITTLSYKLSSILFTCFGAYATYSLTKHLSNRLTAQIAVLILLSFAGFALANVDVRMDAILTGATILAIWQGVLYIDKQRWYHLILFPLFLAMAFGTKGWIGVMVPFFSIVSYAIYKQKTNWILTWRPLTVIALFALFISPILYAYYLQYDLHPELLIRGTTGHSGIRFILWDQVLGRMGGEMGVSGNTDPLFFFHSLLWALLPWGVFFYWMTFKTLFRYKQIPQEQRAIIALTLPAIVLTVIALSVSSFKLPHYLNIIFPLTAIFLADRLTQLNAIREIKTFHILQTATIIVAFVGICIVNYYCFPIQIWGIHPLFIGGIVATLLLLFVGKQSLKRIFTASVLCSATIWFSLNINFYPQVNSHQAAKFIAEKADSLAIDKEYIGAFNQKDDFPFAFDIYHQRVCPDWTIEQIQLRLNQGKPTYLLIYPNDIEQLAQHKIECQMIVDQIDYRITIITLNFLNPETRPEELGRLCLVKAEPQPENNTDETPIE